MSVLWCTVFLSVGFFSNYITVINAEVDPLSKATFKYYLNEYAYQKSKSQFAILNSELIPTSDSSTCDICTSGASVFIQLRRIGVRRSIFASVAIFVCRVAGVDRDVCEGAVELYADILLYIIDNTPDLEGARFCAVYLQSLGCRQPDGYDWSVDIPSGESVPIKVNEISSEPLKVIHISDIHYEPEYVVGSLADCTKPVCCVQESGFPQNGEGTAAGLYGMYGDCDTPWVTVISTFENIAANHPDVDFIYYTGDTVDHRVWNTSIQSNTRKIDQILLQLNASFPGIPVIPVIGNHEPSPVNSFAPASVVQSNISTNWLYDVFANDLQNWFPSSAIETIRRGGYYTVKVRDNLRIIGLNSNLCIDENWWLLYQDWYKDPAGQFQWLVQVLSEAERNNEFVHILSHIPSSNGDYLQTCSREYRRIFERFRHIISGQFNGHSHRDDFTLFFDSRNASEAIGVSYNGGSVQPGVNPNYIVYQLDPVNYEVIEKESWIFNLTEANRTPDQPPTWFKLYDFRRDFGLGNLSPQSLFELVQRMARDSTLRENYVRNRYKGQQVSCDDSCYQNVLCRIVRSEVSDDTQCNEIVKLYNLRSTSSRLGESSGFVVVFLIVRVLLLFLST